MKSLCFFLSVSLVGLACQIDPVVKTSVQFHTSNPALQNLFDMAEQKALWNVKDWGEYKVLVEGAGYDAVWIETQPMGGVMYAKRNIEIAKDNIRIFLDYQRDDGRFRSVIGKADSTIAYYDSSISGLCLPMPALELYYWLNQDKAFLKQLCLSLEKFDDYLWKNRDSDGNGCLETWCVFDNGEDGSIRFGKSPLSWPFAYPPNEERMKTETDYFRDRNADTTLGLPVPIESMDFMSYSYTCRDVLSKASRILGNGREAYWREKADQVKNKIRSYLWNPEKHACYDRDRLNNTMDILLHNNLRCMYFGSFDQQMADEFIHYHLLNPDEFWTPMPLPSIAANDPMFRNITGNNWSGQPQGLTFQRSIRAMENYGHYAELTMIGTRFLKAVGDSLKFPQQFDPFTGTINNTSDGYGPNILATLEFVSRLYGVHIAQDTVHWSCLDDNQEYLYSQQWGDRLYTLETRGSRAFCFYNGREVFSFTRGARVISDLEGRIIKIIGITPDKKDRKVSVDYEGKTHSLSLGPNAIYRYDKKFQRVPGAAFYTCQ